MAYSNIKVSLSADIQDVWEFVTNLNQQLWRRDVASIEILDEKTFIEHLKILSNWAGVKKK